MKSWKINLADDLMETDREIGLFGINPREFAIFHRRCFCMGFASFDEWDDGGWLQVSSG
jgi:hypothetical protein